MLNSLFNPNGVAVIGASSKELHIGNRIIKNLLNFGYKGNIYPINPKSSKICGIRAYKSILDIPGRIDVAHIVIPAKFVPMAVEECGKKGVKNVIINSGGFSETGSEGADIQKDFMRSATKHGIRILGPNCQGIINSDPNVRAYCNFTFSFPEPGNVSIVALSGGVAEVIHQCFVSSDMGTRMYASNGNACDISVPEIIEYLGNDEHTHVIVTYVEGLNNPKYFMETLKKVTPKKPVLAMKAGRTAAGAKVAMSHTGSLVEKSIITDIIFSKAGVVGFTDERKMIDAAKVLASQPMPRGGRVGIITNTGGPAVIATDVLVEHGLELPDLSDKTINFLTGKLHKEASISNPIDVLATGTAEHYKCCLDSLMSDDNIDSILINFVTPFFVDTESIAKEIVKANSNKIKPIVCNLMTDVKQWNSTRKILKDGGIPQFDLPSDAAHALVSVNRYHNIVSRQSGYVRHFDDINNESISSIIREAIAAERYYLPANQVYRILDACGIRTPAWCTVDAPEEVLKVAERIGYPLVIKADDTSIIHKSDVGGVILNLCNKAELQEAMVNLVHRVGNKKIQFLVQKYIPGELELIFGAKSEPNLTHVLMFGLGGVFVEIFKDLAFGLTPITDVEAVNMIKSTKGYNIIKGTRGFKGVKIDLIVELILRLSQLVTNFEQIGELDFNPVTISENNLIVLDARIVLKY